MLYKLELKKFKRCKSVTYFLRKSKITNSICIHGNPNVQLNVGQKNQSNPSNYLSSSVANHNKLYSVDHDRQKCEETINNHYLEMVLNKDAICKFV